MKRFAVLVVLLLLLVSGLALAGSAEPGGSGVLPVPPAGPQADAEGEALPDPVENPGLADDGTGSSMEVAVPATEEPGPPPDTRGFPGPFPRSANILPAPTGL